MANITLTVPDSIKDRVLDGFAAAHGYQARIIGPDQVTMIDNPETKQNFMKRLLREYILLGVKTHEGNRAADTARQAAIASVDADISIS